MLNLLVLAALAASPAATPPDGPGRRERLICKRETKIGSLVATKRTCLTARDWELAEKFNKETVDAWRRAVDGKQRAN